MKVTFCKTKAGKGFKIAVDDKWLYASKASVIAVLEGEINSCQFKPIKDNEE